MDGWIHTILKIQLRVIIARYCHDQKTSLLKKTNLRSSTSEVHVGNDRWEARLDRVLYPEIACLIANGFSGLLSNKVNHDSKYKHILTNASKKKMYKALDAFVDYMASSGYCNDNDEDKVRQVQQFFNTITSEIRIAAFNNTRAGKTVSIQAT